MNDTLQVETIRFGKEGMMSDFSTNAADQAYELTKLRFEGLQSRYVENSVSITELQKEIVALLNSKPYTSKEYADQQNAIKFKENQVHQLCIINNTVKIKAGYLAQILGVTLTWYASD